MVEISTDKNKLNAEMIHSFLTETYWAKGRTIEEVEKSVKNSLCFGVYLDNNQIGFARVLTDYVVFAYIMDVFILPEYRGNDYSKQLMKVIIEYSELQSCTTWMLKTSDAHGLYKQFGFTELKHSEKLMERILK